MQRATYLSWLDLNPSDQVTGLPVKEGDTALALDTKKNATSQALGLETDVKTARLLDKVLVDLDTGCRLPDGEVVGVLLGRPYEVQGGTESLVAPRQSRVNNVLAIAADGNKSSVRVVHQGRGVHFASAQLLYGEVDGLVVLDRGIYRG